MASKKRTAEQEDILSAYRVAAAMIESTDDILTTLRAMKLQESDTELKYEALRDEAVGRLKDDGGFRYVEIDNVKYRAAPKGGGGTDIDIGVLEDELDPELFDKVTRRMVDRDAFTQAVASGEVPAEVFVKAVTEKAGKPFVNFEPADPALSKRPKD